MPDSEITDVTLRIPRDLWDKANRKATEDGVSLEQLVLRATKVYLGIPPEPMNMAIPYNLPKQTRKS